MASGIAATYGYSVAGGVPGGMIAEYVLSNAGRVAVSELAPFLGLATAKFVVGFSLFSVMGAYMEFFAICAYAFAHKLPADTAEQPPSPKYLNGRHIRQRSDG